MILREGLIGTILLAKSPSSCIQGLLLSGWEWILAGSLGSEVALQFVWLDLLCSTDPAQLLRPQVPKFVRRCQSLAGHTYKREVIVLTSRLLCKLTKGKDQLLC